MSKISKASASVSKSSVRNPPEPPKKSLSAFFLYRQEVFDSVRKQNPESKVTEITCIISHMWNTLPPLEKQEFLQKYEKNKAKYEKDKEAYEKKYGQIPTKPRKSRAKSKVK